MGFDHSMYVNFQIKDEVSPEKLEWALRPLLKHLGYKNLTEAEDWTSGFDRFARTTDGYEIETSGEVSDSYDGALRKAAKRLSEVVVSAGFFLLSDHDTGDLDNAVSKIYFGPSPEAILAKKRHDAAHAAIALMEGVVEKSILDQVLKVCLEGQDPTPEKALVSRIANMSLWDWTGDDGEDLNECARPSDGYEDSHNCLMALIEDARKLVKP